MKARSRQLSGPPRGQRSRFVWEGFFARSTQRTSPCCKQAALHPPQAAPKQQTVVLAPLAPNAAVPAAPKRGRKAAAVSNEDLQSLPLLGELCSTSTTPCLWGVHARPMHAPSTAVHRYTLTSKPAHNSQMAAELLVKFPEAAPAAAKEWVSRYQEEAVGGTAELLTLLVQV